MNIFDYLDRKNKRRHIQELIWDKEQDLNTANWALVSEFQRRGDPTSWLEDINNLEAELNALYLRLNNLL